MTTTRPPAAASDARVFTGGPILTMEPGPRPAAVAVAGDRIVAVGDHDDCLAAVGPGAVVVDLAGRALLPGFVDAHTHPVMLGMCAGWVDCSPSRVGSIAELVGVLQTAAAATSPGMAVRGFGYDQGRLAERRHPTAADLDRASTHHPVLLMHTSGHGSVVNHHGLRTLGLDRATPSPPGGELGRTSDGDLDGRVWDAACDLLTGIDGVKVGNHGPNLHVTQERSEVDAALARAQAELLAVGITTVADAQVTGKEMDAYVRARARGDLQLRVHLLVLSSLLDELDHLGLHGPFGDDRLALLGVKLYADGSLTGGTAYLPGSYLDPCQHGHRYHEPDDLRRLVRRVHAMGLQAAVHAQGDAAIETVLEAIESIPAADRPDARWRIEHCGLPTWDQVARMADLGVVPVGQPQHVTELGDAVFAALGDRGATYTPYGWFRDAGLPVVLSSDAPVVRPNPFAGVAAAVTRTTTTGRSMGPDELRLTVTEALRGYTMGGAWALRREHEVGSLRAGKLADLIVVDRDPTQVPPEALGSVRVDETWVGGHRIPPHAPATAIATRGSALATTRGSALATTRGSALATNRGSALATTPGPGSGLEVSA